MASWTRPSTFLVLWLASCAGAQTKPSQFGDLTAIEGSQLGNPFDQSRLVLWMMDNAENQRKQFEKVSDFASKLDLKAPRAARREYEKGLRFLGEKSFDRALDSLTKSLTIYPSFVAAHNRLGTAYLEMGKNQEAEKEFAESVALDKHLPNSYLNLGRAQLALRNFTAAEESIEKAAELAPLDLQLLTALTYSQFLNHDYTGAIATAHRVHEQRHDSAAIVHYLAAAAWQEQNNLQETQNELQIFLAEDPKSFVAGSAQQMIEELKQRRDHPMPAGSISYSTSSDFSDARARGILQRLQQQRELAQVESEPEGGCESCEATDASAPAKAIRESARVSARPLYGLDPSSVVLHSKVNEVAVFFAATDHGRSVSDLTREEVVIRDNGKPPAAVVGFRNESQLPLRLGLVIDTSSSIIRQFAFEQKAAASFLQQTLTDKRDLAFVEGFSSTVLMVQDFTANQAEISQGIEQLAPAGGTALWDAVKFASDKLASRPEQDPVARILVVISDGDDNSSSVSLKQAIENAERNEVIVYAVSTRGLMEKTSGAEIGDQAMKVLASRTGGASFFPDSLRDLNRRFEDLQEVIRSRYLISYKPAHFEANGQYRSIALVAHKSGHKLHVYARRGYYANEKPAN